MEIAIVGAGSISAVAMMTCLMKGDKVTCYYDPDTPITEVGESATYAVLNKICETCDFSVLDDMGKLDATLRWGTKYFWEKANDKQFTVNYALPGIHFNSAKFSKYVIEQFEKRYPSHFKLIPERVKELVDAEANITVITETTEKVFDYVFDCMGTPTAEEMFDGKTYEKPDFVGVNSAILYQDFKPYEEDFTSSTAHENGWMFGVPLQHRKAFGYLYDSNYTTLEEAISNFSGIKNDIDVSKLKRFTWNQYYRKNVQTGRVLYLGNKLYFFEPHQAIPLHYSHAMLESFYSNQRSLPPMLHENAMNVIHMRQMNLIQDLIALNYAGENKIETKFWKDKRSEALARLNKSEKFVEWAKSCEIEDKRVYHFPFWYHNERTMREYCQGYGVDVRQWW